MKKIPAGHKEEGNEKSSVSAAIDNYYYYSEKKRQTKKDMQPICSQARKVSATIEKKNQDALSGKLKKKNAKNPRVFSSSSKQNGLIIFGGRMNQNKP